MKPSDDLHQLVGSLTRSEKRYFRLFASMQGGADSTDYLQLFDSVERMAEYDEEELRRGLPHEVARYLPQVKHYLYRIILRSLNQFHSGRNVDAQLAEWIQGAGILFQKRLFAQCRKLLLRARKLATSNDRSLYLMQILVMEYRLAIIEESSAETLDEIGRIFGELIGLGDLQARRNRYWQIQATMFALAKDVGELRSQAETARWERFMENPLLAEGLASDDPISRLYCMFAYDHFYEVTGEYDEVYRWRTAMVEFIESEPSLVQRTIDRYIPALYNLCQVLIQTGRFEEFESRFERLLEQVAEARRVAPGYPDLHIRSLRPRMLIERGDFGEAMETLREFEEEYGRTRNSLRIGMRGYIEYLFGYAAFATGDYGTSLTWLGSIVNARGRGLAVDIQCYARLLNLIVHYELGNLRLLEYQITSVKRYLKGRNRLFAFERSLLQLVGRLALAPHKPERRELLNAARDEVALFRSDRFESQAFSHFDLLAWIDAKLDDVGYVEAIRRSRECAVAE